MLLLDCGSVARHAEVFEAVAQSVRAWLKLPLGGDLEFVVDPSRLMCVDADAVKSIPWKASEKSSP